MPTVADLYRITKQLLDLLSQPFSDDQRHVTIEQINDLLKARQQIIDGLSEQFTKEDKELGKDLVEMNDVIHNKLLGIMSEVKNDLIITNKKRQSNQKYVNPYQNISRDGMFLDKRK